MWKYVEAWHDGGRKILAPTGFFNIRVMAQIPVRFSSFRNSKRRPKQRGSDRNNLISVSQKSHADVLTHINNINRTNINNNLLSKSFQKSKIKIAHLNL